MRLLCRLLLLAAASFALLACPSEPPPETDATSDTQGSTLCSGGTPSYGIQDYPCPAATVEGWVAGRDGDREREHAWYLFAGLNQPAGDSFLWHTWPTSSQAFPGQFDSQNNVGVAKLDLASQPGAILERPTPGTPRHAGSDLTEGETLDPGVDAENLSLPGAPKYSVPTPVAQQYPQCVNSNGQLIDGPRFQNNGDIMVAGVVYSPDAAQWILDQQLYNGYVLDDDVPQSTSATTTATTMPTDSIVLKPQMWPVPWNDYTALPLWDFANPDADEIVVDGTTCEIYSGFERQDLWTRAVAVTRLNAQIAVLDVTYLDSPYVQLATSYDAKCQATYEVSGGITYQQARVVRPDRFYSITFTEEEFAAMDPCDRALLDQSAYWSYGRAFEQQDALVLIAMHMMTKEQPTWTFQSAWWFDQALNCPSENSQCQRFAQDRPSDVAGAPTWQNYLMTATYGQNQKPKHTNTWPTNLSTDTTWPLAFNPYIELAATHPIETNCINCHKRAAWPSRVTTSKEYPNRNSAYLLEGAQYPGLLDMFDTNNALFDGLTNVDNMWAISDRAYYPKLEVPAGGGEEDLNGDAD